MTIDDPLWQTNMLDRIAKHISETLYSHSARFPLTRGAIMTDRASTERLLAADPTEEWVADEWAHRSSESDRASAEGLRVLQQIRDAANGTDLSDPTISAIFDIASAALRDEDIMEAWGIIANVGGGDWTTQTQEWQDAAARWRDRVIPALSTPRTETPDHD